MKLKARIINLLGPKKLVFKETSLDTSKIAPNEIVAQTIFSAISPGTETSAYAGKPPLRPTKKVYPRLMGYCNVAKILSVGKNIKGLKFGDLILTGESHRSAFTTKEEDIFAKIPKGVEPEDATLTYLYNLGLTSLQSIKLKPDMTVAIIGLGVLGLGIIEQAKNLGAKVFAFSDSQHKLKLAKKLGAEKVYPKNKSSKLEKLADLVITTSNSWEDWQLALRLVKDRGAISVLGFPGRGATTPDFNPLDPRYFYDKKIVIIPTGRFLDSRSGGTIKGNCAKILNMMAKKKLKPQELVSGVYDYREIERVYEKLLTRDQKSITYILKWL